MEAVRLPRAIESSSFRSSRPLSAVVVPAQALSFLIATLACMTSVGAQEPAAIAVADRDAAAYFETSIAPLLETHCYDCHSHATGEASGGLVLDSRAGWEIGGDSGPAVVPGKPAESLLVKAIAYDDPELQMPPDGKLDDETLAALTEWIRRGAPDPRGGSSVAKTTAAIDVEAGRNFWAYRPIVDPALPEVVDTKWPTAGVDRFILARLESGGFAPAPEADRATLLRRLTLDLTGLPPTPEEIDAFADDPSPDAWERQVDRLLASPAFAERFARRWLDVVRYGESMTLRGLVFHEAWRFRDYVIDAYAEDRPWNRVIAEHVGGDLLPAQSLEERQRNRVATGFLVMGNKNLEEQDKKALDLDAVDEQLDTIGKAFLGQTIGCARCHDHKFDPIPTRDYYAMAGILLNSRTLVHANVSDWTEDPLPLPPEDEARYAAHDAETLRLETLLADGKKAMAALAKAGAPADGMISVGSLAGVAIDDAAATQVGIWTHSTYLRPFVGAGYVHDDNLSKGEMTITLTAKLPQPGEYEVRFGYAPGTNRATNVPVTVFSADGEKTILIDERQAPPIDQVFISLGRFRFEKDGQSFVLVSNEGTDGVVVVDAVQFLPVESESDAAIVAEDPAVAERARLEAEELRAESKRLEAELKTHQASLPKRPTAMAVREAPTGEIADARIRIRGMPHNLGDTAPRGFLQVATTSPQVSIAAGQSGRRELGEWLASADNPLTARVYANRVWTWLIGEGLVRTTDNFGASGETPSHPELLDWLASRLKEENWSSKNLVREIVLSRTYRMSSAAAPEGDAVDPENRLLRRALVKRTDAETLRDAMLSIAGRLDRRTGGSDLSPKVAADYDHVVDGIRRSVYLPALRNSTPEIVKTFDGADPSAVTGRRSDSVSAAQALYLLNDPFVEEQAAAAADRAIAEATGFDERLERLYRRTLGRSPSDAERAVARAYVADDSNAGRVDYRARWGAICQALFASADFRRIY